MITNAASVNTKSINYNNQASNKEKEENYRKQWNVMLMLHHLIKRVFLQEQIW